MRKILITTFVLLSLAIGCYAYAANFGYENIGGSTYTLDSGQAAAFIFTSPNDAIKITALTAYIEDMRPDPGAKLCVWLNSTRALVGCTPEIIITTVDWWSAPVNLDITPSTDYLLGLVVEERVKFFYDAGTTDYGATTTMSYTVPTTFIKTALTNYKMSMYATYQISPPGNLNIMTGSLEVKTGSLTVN
jgi:hypothetical protein